MKHKVVCIGAVLVDELYYCNQPVLAATSNPAVLKRIAGGVMRNIVHHLVLLDIPVQFITVLGNDEDGHWLKESCEKSGINMSNAMTADCNTGKYAALLNPDGSLFAAAASNPCEAFLTIDMLRLHINLLSSATIMVADTNLEGTVLEWLIAFSRERNIKLIIEPVSVEKAKKLSGIKLEGLFMLTPNEDELTSLNTHSYRATAAIRELEQRGVQHIWLRKGVEGSEIYSMQNSYSLRAPEVIVKDITGAGDAALAAWIAAYCLGMGERQCLVAAHSMAAAVLQAEGAIATAINQQKLFSSVKEYYPDEK